MRIKNVLNNKIYSFTFRDKNQFLVSELDIAYDLLQIHDVIFSQKMKSDIYEINFEEFDELNDRGNTKIIRIPSFFDLYKDIQSSSKAILKELLILIFENNLFEIPEIIDAIQTINEVDWTRIEKLKKISEEINNEIDPNSNLKFVGDIISYLAENIVFKFEISDIKYSQTKLLGLYLIILKNISYLTDKKYHILCFDPFRGISNNDATMIKKLFLGLASYSIVMFTRPFMSEWNELLQIKIIGDECIDFINVVNNVEKYNIYLNTKSADATNVIKKVFVSYINAKFTLFSGDYSQNFKNEERDIFLAILNNF